MEHEQSYKLLFSHADLLRGFVCEDGVKALDFTSLEKMSSSYKRRRTSRGALWWEIEALLLTKATVVLALLKRAGATMTNGLSPVLTANGFQGASGVRPAFCRGQISDGCNEAQGAFKELLDCKYFFERNPEAYSVIVAPVLWPDPSPQIVTVGAGDMTSSVVTIFSGK